MDLVVLDCSVAIAFFFKDEASSYTDSVFNALTEGVTALVPSIWPLEITDVCLTAERRKRIKPADTSNLISILETFPIEIDSSCDPKTLRSIVFLAREYNLTSYDAAYLELAIRKGCPLATLDKKLKQATPKARIPVWKMNSA